MQRRVIALLVLLAATYAAADADVASSAVRVLTDVNFEHDTQAVTGSTTGDWFVEFYAPWCGHCKRLEETWEKLASKLAEDKEAGEITPIIAKVDGTQAKGLSERFKIQGFPTLLMFSKGKMYTYDGGRDFESLYDWCKDRKYRKGESVPVPKGWDQMSVMDKAMEVFEKTIKSDMEQIWKYHKAAFFLALGLVFVLGLTCGAMLCGSKAKTVSATPSRGSGRKSSKAE